MSLHHHKFYGGPERRKYPRTRKNFSLVFYYKDGNYKKSDGTFIRDISKGGVRFTTSNDLKVGTVLMIEIGLPLIAPRKLVLEGTVVSTRKVAALINEIRAKFNGVTPDQMLLLDTMEQQQVKDQK